MKWLTLTRGNQVHCESVTRPSSWIYQHGNWDDAKTPTWIGKWIILGEFEIFSQLEITGKPLLLHDQTDGNYDLFSGIDWGFSDFKFAGSHFTFTEIAGETEGRTDFEYEWRGFMLPSGSDKDDLFTSGWSWFQDSTWGTQHYSHPWHPNKTHWGSSRGTWTNPPKTPNQFHGDWRSEGQWTDGPAVVYDPWDTENEWILEFTGGCDWCYYLRCWWDIFQLDWSMH